MEGGYNCVPSGKCYSKKGPPHYYSRKVSNLSVGSVYEGHIELVHIESLVWVGT